MAQVSVGWEMQLTAMDNGGNMTTKTYNLRGTDATEAAANGAAVLAAFAAVSDAAIVGYTVGERFANDALAYPGVGVQIENLALIETEVDGDPTKTATFTIPAPNIGIFVGSSGDAANTVDPTDTNLLAYHALFAAAGDVYISDGEDAGAIKSGKRIHRASRRG